MFSTNLGIFIQFPGGSSNRVLHPANITGVSAPTCTAELDETDVQLQAGQDVLVYYRLKRKRRRDRAVNLTQLKATSSM